MLELYVEMCCLSNHSTPFLRIVCPSYTLLYLSVDLLLVCETTLSIPLQRTFSFVVLYDIFACGTSFVQL